MKPPRRWLAILAAAVLAGCSAPGDRAAGEAAASSAAPEIAAIAGAGDVKAMRIPAALAPHDIHAAAKASCGSASFCQVYGWVEPDLPAQAMPMTDAELERLAFRYAVNRDSGYESAAWDCRRWPRRDRAECL